MVLPIVVVVWLDLSNAGRRPIAAVTVGMDINHITAPRVHGKIADDYSCRDHSRDSTKDQPNLPDMIDSLDA